MSDRSWTPAQKDAISARGGSLIVSAAAGSGKTAVLTERVVEIICGGDTPVDIDKILIVTFSNAAAAEMRQRIGARLSSMMQKEPENYRLQRQQALLQKANISTIHSFCLGLIRDNFHNLAIAPDFTVADQGEMEIMRAECAAEVIERFYSMENLDEFLELVELLSGGRDDSRLVEAMLKIYDFSRSHPFHEDWLDEKMDMYRGNIPISETPWGREILAYTRESLEFCNGLASECADGLEYADEKLMNAYLPAIRSDLFGISKCLSLAEIPDWDGLCEGLRGFVFERLGAVRDGGPDKDRIKALRDRYRDIIRALADKHLNASEYEALDDIRALAPKVEVLFSLVKEFGRALDRAKAAKKRLDFSDLEHLALQLLVEKGGLGYTRTGRAEEISLSYEYVMVDEYQDTNEVQDLIFTSVSRDQRNLFMVGDVKQSIYSFRQAMPEIFLRKKEAFFPFDGLNYPAAVNLDVNFRSRREVTEAVNFIFAGIMSKRVGEVDYDRGEALKCGASYPAYDAAAPELILLDLSEIEADSDDAEAREIAGRICEMLESGYKVADGESMRPTKPGDFCILLRSPKNRARTYVKALTEMGIPSWAENSGGFLEAREVSMVFSLLRALDNPLLDIELVAAMLSPLFGFTDDDIAKIRTESPRMPFFTAVTVMAEKGDEKCVDFLAAFNGLRRDAGSLSADRLLLRIYERTSALDIARAMPSGESRRANLLLLVEYAAKYHAIGYKKLAGFVGFISRLEERGGDMSPAGAGGASDAVKVMSIHRSKGLEFPVVILAGTAKAFNKEDLRRNTLLHSKYGFACSRRDMVTRGQYTTVPMQAIRLAAERSLLSEEMRILYVALTRAREKLIITAAVKQPGKKLSALSNGGGSGEKLSPYMTGEAGSFADWILASLLRHKSCDNLREAAGTEPSAIFDDGNPWKVSILNSLPEYTAAEKTEVVKAAPDKAMLEELVHRARFVYPYFVQTMIPAKLAVSSVAKGDKNVEYRFAARPAFLMDEKLTASEKGNAMHKFMQFADYASAKKDITNEILRMKNKAFLSAAEAASLSKPKLEKFFSSPLADRIFQSPKVWRELKFMAEFGREELGGYIENMDGGSLVVLQGVADCVFIEDGEAVIVDYKTDRVKTADELRSRYSAQLELYKKILSRSLEVPVRECVIYSFALSREVW